MLDNRGENKATLTNMITRHGEALTYAEGRTVLKIVLDTVHSLPFHSDLTHSSRLVRMPLY